MQVCVTVSNSPNTLWCLGYANTKIVFYCLINITDITEEPSFVLHFHFQQGLIEFLFSTVKTHV